MKCHNFFCHNYNKEEWYNCAVSSYQAFKEGEYGVADCKQRKAFNRFQNRMNRYESPILNLEMPRIKEELDN